ncbi:MAG: ribonuclease Y [Calditrichaceae bacterium]|nr:ribonuclease Y [Calditrichaceae bacterium]MBN2708853.1 ribonuclease Y [Calditrichaceae bacterium]RQV97620.1 MAG: ribonuclease Y [Calditrichota bacterium]
MIDFIISNFLYLFIIVLFSVAIGIIGYHLILVNKKSTAKQIVDKIRRDIEKDKKDELYKFKVEMQTKRSKFEQELRQREEKYQRTENQVLEKEKELRRKENQIKILENRFDAKEKKINELEEMLYERHRKVDGLIEEQNKQLETLSSLSIEDAKKQLLKNLEGQAKLEAVHLANEIKEEAKEKAQREAKEIIALAIENLAYEFTMESTLSTVELPNERFKGMIIGREGRNIRAFEEATGVKVIVDDTPELVVLSGYDPVAREVARIAMQNLIKNKSINVNNIQQVVDKASAEVQRSIIKAADDTLRELKITDVHPKMRENLGRLKYRYSYGQNMLQHSKEVAFLTGAMAAELGFNVKLARRAGLFHDIGKAISNNSEGSHVTLGVELAEKCNEHKVVINAILAHHEEAEPIHPISVLVTAADKISGGRPGARRDTLEAYTKRITKLEEIANSFEGVQKTYAISAGREIRVIVEPEQIADDKATVLSGDIAAKIRESMEFPGQIKVCVIRQTIASKFTDDYEPAVSLEEK